MHEMSLVHALVAARDVARQHEGQVWRRLEDRLTGLVAAVHSEDPDDHVGREPRLDRQELDASHGDEIMAVLLPLGDAPDETRAEVALERLDLLDGGAGRDDRAAPPEPDPALTDEGW